MKKIINLVLVLMIFFMGLNSCAIAKKVKTDTKTKTVKEKVKKEKNKTPKVKSEKIKTEKPKKEKVKKEKAQKPEKVKKTKKEEPQKAAKQKAEKKQKVSKKDKEKAKEEVKVSDKQAKKKKVKDLSELTQVEREKALLERPYTYKKRSALAMYLNPNLDITEIRASHILVKNRKDAVNIRKDIMNGTITFEQAAKQYSLCPTGVNGGDLGYFNRKRMDQQFTDRAFDLKIGQVSEPVGTRFGWHLIKVVDKR